MRYIQLITVGIGLLMLSACSDSDLTILEVHGASSDKLDVLLVPSHYYGPDAGSDQQWLTDAERVRAGLIEHHFWINYREKINVYRLDISTDDDFFMSGNNWIPDDQRIKAFAQQHFPGLDFGHNDQIIFVIDVAGYESDPLFDSDIGLTRGDPNITKLEMSKLGALVHEFGHAFGDLGDEYPKQINNPTWVSIYPNIATTQPNDTCEDKWGDLMDVVTPTIGIPIGREDRMVGCFQSSNPASAAITFKPTGHMCIMDRNSFNLPFCPVCQRHLVTLMAQYSPSASCAASPAEFRNRASFEQAAGGMLTLIDFDTLPNGVPIQADSPGVLIESQFASEGLQFTSGVIFGEPNLPSGGSHPPIPSAIPGSICRSDPWYPVILMSQRVPSGSRMSVPALCSESTMMRLTSSLQSALILIRPRMTSSEFSPPGQFIALSLTLKAGSDLGVMICWLNNERQGALTLGFQQLKEP